jgi:hypothetical protein
MKLNKNIKINTNIKLNKNIKINTNTILIIILVSLLIILGIYWLYKRSKIIEGQQEPQPTAQAQKLADNIMNSFNEAGVDIKDIEPVMNAMKNVKDILKQSEADLVDPENIYAEEKDISGNLINTTPDTYPGKTFLAGNDRISDSFCEVNKNKPDLNAQCNKLTASHCNQTSCCVFLNGKQCVAGNETGPHITTDAVTGFDIDYTYYSHKNTCYGSCGDGMSQTANPCSRYKDDSTGISKECIKRYWNQTNCPNQNFITDSLVNEMRDHSRLSIKEKIKEYATKEKYFDKCYGSNQSNWPAPCTGTTPTSFGLSQRCLTHLFKDAGCPFVGTINQAFVDEHVLEPKSAMINKFSGYFNGNDTESRQKCYGYDQMSWPDPCEGIPDTTLVSDVPKECLIRTARNVYKDQCTKGIQEILNNRTFTSKPGETLNKVKQTPETEINDMIYKKENRMSCYGSNPNEWPTINKVSPDPCQGILFINKNNFTELNEISFGCRQRLSELVSDIDMKNNLKSRKPKGKLLEVLNIID